MDGWLGQNKSLGQSLKNKSSLTRGKVQKVDICVRVKNGRRFMFWAGGLDSTRAAAAAHIALSLMRRDETFSSTLHGQAECEILFAATANCS
jgi:hypothetical protein